VNAIRVAAEIARGESHSVPAWDDLEIRDHHDHVQSKI